MVHSESLGNYVIEAAYTRDLVDCLHFYLYTPINREIDSVTQPTPIFHFPTEGSVRGFAVSVPFDIAMRAIIASGVAVTASCRALTASSPLRQSDA